MKVYLIENTQNGKGYVGITTKPLSERWRYHVHASKSAKTLLAKAIRKYGTDTFKMKTIEKCDSEVSLRKRETFWIEKLETFVKQGGYNMTLGGDGIFGYRHTDEAKAAMSRARMGKKLSPAHCKAISKGLLAADLPGNGGRPFGTPQSAEARAKIAAANRRRKYKTTPVIQLDLEGNEIRRFESAQLAAKSLVNGSDSKILSVCRGLRQTHKKCKWRYAPLEV